MFDSKKFNKIIGKTGEDKASKFLKSNGYKILHRNFETNIGEIDIIAYKSGMIVFVEVKTRSSDYFGMPREAVTYQKQKKIRMVATQYLKYRKKLDSPCRFDVIEIIDNKITHLIDCF